MGNTKLKVLLAASFSEIGFQAAANFYRFCKSNDIEVERHDALKGSTAAEIIHGGKMDLVIAAASLPFLGVFESFKNSIAPEEEKGTFFYLLIMERKAGKPLFFLEGHTRNFKIIKREPRETIEEALEYFFELLTMEEVES